MSNNKRKQLLNENEVRKFMKFANIGSDVSDKFLSENYADTEEIADWGWEENDELEEMCADDHDKLEEKDELNEAGGMEPEEPLEDEGPPMDLEGGDEELEVADQVPEMADELPEPAAGGEAAEVTITPEELEVLTKVLGDLVAAQGGEGGEEELDMGGEEELPPPEEDLGGEMDMGGEELPEEEPMMESMVNKIAQRVAKRLMKETKKKV